MVAEDSIHKNFDSVNNSNNLIKQNIVQNRKRLLSSFYMNSAINYLEQFDTDTPARLNLIIKSPFQLHAPDIILNFVSKQIQQSFKFKNLYFLKNFQVALVVLLNNLLRLRQNDIIGIKILVTGK